MCRIIFSIRIHKIRTLGIKSTKSTDIKKNATWLIDPLHKGTENTDVQYMNTYLNSLGKMTLCIMTLRIGSFSKIQ